MSEPAQTIVDLALEPSAAQEIVVSFQLAPGIPDSTLVARSVATAIEKGARKVAPGAKPRVVGRRLESLGEGRYRVPMERINMTEASALQDHKSVLLEHVNELGAGAAGFAQRLGD